MFRDAAESLGVTKRESGLAFLFLAFAAACGYAWRWALHRIRETILIGENLRAELSKQLLNAHVIIEAQHKDITKLRESRDLVDAEMEEMHDTIAELRKQLKVYQND